MRYSFFDSQAYRRKQAEIVRSNWRKGIYKCLIKEENRNCLNNQCPNNFIVNISDKQKYCSQKCWYIVRKNYRISTCPPCISCGKLVTQKGASKFCSLKCQSLSKYNFYIERWKNGLEDGLIGIRTKSVSAHIRRYLSEKFGEECARCGWNKKHPKTLVVPLEINHIDGNSENNKEENLELICPNCHALTPNFRNLNKGKGREWRLLYLKKRQTD